MAHPHWQRIKELFAAASALPAEQRDTFLAAQPDDTALLAEVRSLLTAHPPTAAPAPTAPAAFTETAGARIGPYKLLERIGEGGFGTVWMAEQEQPVRRRVALKVVKAGMDSQQVIARFEQERQALALMDHPNIAHVFDGGTTPGGRPFFVMELVKGDPITEYCDREKLTPAERLRLFVDVGRAVQHAHQKGVIHRDLKPNNVLVTIVDGKPVAKVIDFGVAKATQGRLTDKTLFTEHKQMIGTPLYMSPEQAHISGVDVDTRSDVYSLGVMLYELLTGTTPFRREELLEAGLAEMHRVLREVEPPKPSTRFATLGKTSGAVAAQRRVEVGKLGVMLRGDLDWIVMKCLEKERARRYDTASALVQDVERHLAGEAVEAAPPSVVYRVRKFVRRRKGQVAAVAAVGLVAAGGLGAFVWSEQRSVKLQMALVEARESETYRASIRNAVIAMEQHQVASAMQQLDACPEQQRGFEWHYLRSRNQAVARFEGRRVRFDFDWGVDPPAPSWDGETADLWDTAGHRMVEAPGDGVTPVVCAMRTATGPRIVARRPADRGAMLDVYDIIDGTRRLVTTLSLEITRQEGLVVDLVPFAGDEGYVEPDPLIGRFSPDGSWLIITTLYGRSELWDTRTWIRARALPDDQYNFAFHPNGGRLVMCGDAGDPVLCDTATGSHVLQLRGHDGRAREPRFSADGSLLMTLDDSSCRVWDSHTGAALAVLRCEEQPFAACFTSDGRGVVVGSDLAQSELGRVRVWSVASQDVTLNIEADSRVLGVAASANGRWLASAGADGVVCVWDAISGTRLAEFTGQGAIAYAPVFSPQCDYLAASEDNGTRVVWTSAHWESRPNNDLLTPQRYMIHAGVGCGAIDGDAACWFHPDSGHLYVGRKVVDPVTGATLDDSYGSTRLTGLAVPCGVNGLVPPLVNDPPSIDEEVLYRAPLGPRMLSRSRKEDDPSIMVRDSRSGALLRQLACAGRVAHAECSAKIVASVTEQGVIAVHDLQTGVALCTAAAAMSPCSVHPSPDGRLVLVAGTSPYIMDARSGELVCHLLPPTRFGSPEALRVRASDWGRRRPFSWAPDSQRVAGKYARTTIAVWDAQTGVVAARLEGNANTIYACCFHPDGTRIATCCGPSLHLYDAATGLLLMTIGEAATDADREADTIAFSPDGHMLASVAGSHFVVHDTAPAAVVAKRFRSMQSARERARPMLASLLQDNPTPTTNVLDIPHDHETQNALAALLYEHHEAELAKASILIERIDDPQCSATHATEALAQFDRVQHRFSTDHCMLKYWRAVACWRLGKPADALRWLTNMDQAMPGNLRPRVEGLLAMAHARTGDRLAAAAHLAKLEEWRARGVDGGHLATLQEAQAVFAECFPDTKGGK